MIATSGVWLGNSAEPTHTIATMSSASPQRLFPVAADRSAPRPSNTSVFGPNMTLPVHRWFRYSAGFSAAWAEATIEAAKGTQPMRVLDPFAGSGTTLLSAQMLGVDSIGLETHPLVVRIARAKLAWNEDAEAFERRARQVVTRSAPRIWSDPPALLSKIYPPTTLATLLGLRDAIDANHEGDPVDDLLWLALLAVLRPCSPVGTAQWQYVLPKKAKARAAEPLPAFEAQVQCMADDMRAVPRTHAAAEVLAADARHAEGVTDDSVDLVLTSPPYPNNYDYADATRIEMTFLGEIERWSDLQEAVRTHLLRSCSQHMSGYDPSEALQARELEPIRAELLRVYDQLSDERENHGGRKAYHLMVVAYFHDLAHAWRALRRVCRPGATVYFVVGDSAPYGIHLPVERWLGELALGQGFRHWSFEKLRDRNTKWKNRKHRVPLHEGILTVQA